MIKIRKTTQALWLGTVLLAMGSVASAAGAPVPEQFQRFDNSSVYTIDYSELNGLFGSLVVDVGRSNRQVAQPAVAKTGTRMKSSINRATASEGNRFLYELFEDNENNQNVLAGIQKSLEQIPSEVPLESFSRDEQLAYWLNLYNVTMVNEVVKVYPKKKLNNLLVGKKSVLSDKVLTVAGVPLSLDDIQHTILKQNYNNDPLIMYGLYQGIIGGPNIRRKAYTGENVYRNLEANAIEFINSNRGTSGNKKTFRVSSLYKRNKEYFGEFDPILKEHLLRYLEGEERAELQSATKIKADINDWAVTDLFGTYRDVGGSLASNSAALQGAVRGGGSDPSGVLLAKSPGDGQYSEEMLKNLYELKEKHETVKEENATVTIEELGEIPVESAEKAESGLQ